MIGADRFASLPKLFLSRLIRAAALVWPDDGEQPDESLSSAWRRIYGEPMPPELGTVPLGSSWKLRLFSRSRFVMEGPKGTTLWQMRVEGAAPTVLERRASGLADAVRGVVGGFGEMFGVGVGGREPPDCDP